MLIKGSKLKSVRRLAVGIDLGGTNIKGALVDARGRVHARAVCKTEANKGPKRVVENLARVISELVATSGQKRIPLGLSVPGETDDKGRIWRFPNIKGFHRYPLAAELAASLPVGAVVVENDAICAALAEHRLGAAKPYDNFLQVTLGTGIGGGLVLNGKVFRGRDGFGAEIGHMAIHYKGRPCGCGATGCMEAYAAAGGILKTYKAMSGHATSVREISERAAKGEARALACFKQAGSDLGHGLASILNVLNLDAIVFSGGIRKAVRYMKPAMKKMMKERCMGEPVSKLPLLLTKLGDDAGAVGAALLAFDV